MDAETVEVQGQQMMFLPESVPRAEPREVPLGELPDVRARPAAEMVASIAAVGVLQSVALIERESGGYVVADGRRRIAAARKAAETGVETGPVHAMVFPAGTPMAMASAITLITNTQRSENPVHELEAIEQLMAEGADVQTIARELGIPVQTIQRRLRMTQLVPPLREALNEGQIAPSVAERAASLPNSRQEGLAEILFERGRVTGHDVAEARRVRQSEAMALLPDEVFNAPAIEDVAGGPAAPEVVEIPADGDPWYPCRTALEHALDLVPEPDGRDAAKVRAAIHRAMKVVSDVAGESDTTQEGAS